MGCNLVLVEARNDALRNATTTSSGRDVHVEEDCPIVRRSESVAVKMLASAEIQVPVSLHGCRGWLISLSASQTGAAPAFLPTVPFSLVVLFAASMICGH